MGQQQKYVQGIEIVKKMESVIWGVNAEIGKAHRKGRSRENGYQTLSLLHKNPTLDCYLEAT